MKEVTTEVRSINTDDNSSVPDLILWELHKEISDDQVWLRFVLHCVMNCDAYGVVSFENGVKDIARELGVSKKQAKAAFRIACRKGWIDEDFSDYELVKLNLWHPAFNNWVCPHHEHSSECSYYCKFGLSPEGAEELIAEIEAEEKAELDKMKDGN